LLARAADLRAAGAAWDAVARALNRAAATVRKWPELYRTRWRAALHAADERLVAETTAEAVHVLRRLLRSADEKIQRDAAKLLVDLRAGRPAAAAPTSPEPASDAARFVALLESQTHDHLLKLDAALHGPQPPARGPDDDLPVGGAG
jgi:hypothetical protein